MYIPSDMPACSIAVPGRNQRLLRTSPIIAPNGKYKMIKMIQKPTCLCTTFLYYRS